MSNILIIAKGTYGDMFPMYALAQQLQKRGHKITFATHHRHEDITRLLGFPVVILNQANQNNPYRFFNPFPDYLSPENLSFEVNVLLNAALNTDLIIGNQLAFFGALLAKKLGKPWIYCPVSPLAIASRHDQSLFPYLHNIQRLTTRHQKLQRLYLSIHRRICLLMMSSVTPQRRLLDSTDRLHPHFEGMYSSDLNLFLTSSVLVEKQCDWPDSTRVTGFTWFEPDFFKDVEKTSKLEAFLDAGTSPVVFALGGTSRGNPGAFFHESIKVCKLLGIRGIIVAASRFHSELAGSDDILITNYIPYSSLFQRVQAVVHSGGIGTIGWCLRYGVPSLLLPTFLDQFDNAYRASQKGFADVIFDKKYRAAQIASSLSDLLNDKQKRSALAAASKIVAQEDGVQVACDSIEQLCIMPQKNAEFQKH